MQVLAGVATLGGIALGGLLLLHGVANVLDAAAIRLHKAARSLRRVQDSRTRALTAQWVRQLEADD